MKIYWVAACVVAAVITTDCSAHGASGTYIARGQGFVEMLQITQSQDGQLLGSMASTMLKHNGSLTQNSTNISGVVDGHALTLVAKSPFPLIPDVNMPGTINSGVITITNSNGQEQFIAGSPGDYQAAVQQLQTQGAEIQQLRTEEVATQHQQKRLADEDAAVAALDKRLTEYAALVRQPVVDRQLAAFHAVHAHALERARHGLEIQQRYQKGSVQAGQMGVAINQIEVQLQVYDNPLYMLPEQYRTHIRQFDIAIAQSICHVQKNLPNCAQQPDAVQAYQSVRTLVLRRADDIEMTLKKDDAAMKAIVAQADGYE
jgi:hypothetical protein